MPFWSHGTKRFFIVISMLGATIALLFVGSPTLDLGNLELRHAIIAEINQARLLAGVPIVKGDSRLMDQAQSLAGQTTVSDPKVVLGKTRSIQTFVKENATRLLGPDILDIGVGALLDKEGKPSIALLTQSQSEVMKDKELDRVVIERDAWVARRRIVSVNFRTSYPIRSFRVSEDGGAYGDWITADGKTRYFLNGDDGQRLLFFQILDTRGETHSLVDSIVLQSSPVWADVDPNVSVFAPVAPPLEVIYKQVGPEQYTVPLIFPMLGAVKWTDTWGASRAAGTRKHMGQDLPSEKLRPILAAVDGVLRGSILSSESGISCAYYHLNNDSPGTDDGKGSELYQYAPGVYSGMRVIAGQHIAYNGDSGNAEETIPHLHFELNLPGLGTVNAAPSLMIAKTIKAPVYVAELPELRPEKKQVRWDAQVQSISADGLSARVNIAVSIGTSGKVLTMLQLNERTIDLTKVWLPLNVCDFISVIGNQPATGRAMIADSVSILRRP